MLKLTRKSVEALRARAMKAAHEYPQHDDSINWYPDIVLVCDAYLSTPAAEPTAGDARDIRAAAEAAAERIVGQRITGRSNLDEKGPTQIEYEIAAAIVDAVAAAQRQARPSLGAAADAVMAERERCAQIAETCGLSAQWPSAAEIAAAIRASSPTESPDGSPEGEGGRET